MPATVPCPKIPKHPAKNRRSTPSRSTYCAARKRTRAWAAVIRGTVQLSQKRYGRPQAFERSFLMAVTVRTLENFIGGEWVASTGESARAVVSPVTGETLAEAPDASSEDIDLAVAAARAAQPRWAALSAWERARICHAIADLIVERREVL